MLNCAYRLIAPRTFEPVEIDVATDAKEQVIVRPTYLSICNADVRYYLGKRSADALKKKLPMALIHEGVGVVLRDASGTYSRGQFVVLIPNNPHESDEVIGENYLASSEFCGSGSDGFMQELVVLPTSRLVALPGKIEPPVASFTELVSVAVHAVTRFERTSHKRREVVGVWGDGNLGFLISLVLRAKYPDMRIIVYGRNAYKLNDFTFVDEVHTDQNGISSSIVDHAFECCGGDGSSAAIEHIINQIKPEGTVSLLGVSENAVPVNTRMVLEKGLRLIGSSRSTRQDFEKTIQLYEEHAWMLPYLSSLVGSVVNVKSIADMVRAFEADIHKSMGKTVMQWSV